MKQYARPVGRDAADRPVEFDRFVAYVLKIRRADFLKEVGPEWSERLVAHSKVFAQKSGRPWEYYAGDIDKDAWAKKQRARSAVQQGLVGVWCVKEACATFKRAPASASCGEVRRKDTITVDGFACARLLTTRGLVLPCGGVDL